MRPPAAVLALGGAVMLGIACDSDDTTAFLCSATAGAGTLVVDVAIDSGVAPDVLVLGPGDFRRVLTASATLSDAPAGAYTVEVRRTFMTGAVVGRAFSGAASPSMVCLEPPAVAVVAVTYAVEPGSGKLWVGHTGLEALAYDSTTLQVSGSATASVTIAEAGMTLRGVAFDAQGNLWVADPTGVVRSYPADSLGATGRPEPRLTLSGDGVAGAHALAFDADGALWVANAATNRVSKMDPAQLVRSGPARPRVVLRGPDIATPQGLAFDAAGNLWVASSGANEIVMFAAARLRRSTGGAADVAITGRTAPPVVTVLREPRGLAFDTAGNLWVGHVGQDVLVRYTPAELAASGVKTPGVQITVDVIARGESLAFDEAGSLWFPASEGRLAALTAAQLRTSGHAAAAVALDSPSLALGTGLAFNPAPGALPLQR